MSKKLLHHLAFQLCPLLALTFSILITITTFYINQGLSVPFIFMSVQVYLNWYSIYTIGHNSTTMKCINGDQNLSIITNSIRNINSSTSTLTNSINTITNSINTITNSIHSITNSINTINAINLNTKNITNSINTINPANYHHQSPTKPRYWYCERCASYTYRPTSHCSGCSKCFHLRDHHCFFIGACIIRQNMGNFILICFYTFLACIYSISVLGPYLYENLAGELERESAEYHIMLSLAFPVALARYITGKESFILLVTLFDALLSVGLLCFCYGTWKLYSCLTGRQKYIGEVAQKQEVREIFGSYGLSNFLFPYNGLIGTRDINGKYQLKEV